MEADEYYHELSLRTETSINRLKLTRPRGLDPVIDLLLKHDSGGKFCESIFDERVVEHENEITEAERLEYVELRKHAYKEEIDTVISACTAASEDDIEGMRSLKRNGVDLNIGDYDNRTPIHVAVATGRLKAVKYLVEEAGVIISPVDRWGSTPMNDAESFPEIKKYLLGKGAVIGK